MADNLIYKSNPMTNVEFEDSDPNDWGEWECPNCGKSWEDPNRIDITCCVRCGQIVKLLWTDSKGYREAIADGFLANA